jgi:gamma-glutamyltranspeptidase/glutathione hydrolase
MKSWLLRFSHVYDSPTLGSIGTTARNLRKTINIRVLLTAVLLWTSASGQEVSQSGRELQAERPMIGQPERARTGIVASAHELASQTGVEILRKGGNAVDAAVAVAFALAVVHPEAGNLGGGGYMVVRMSDGRTGAIDYRETAPAAARPGMFKDPAEGRVGYKASAVPGTVAGMALAHSTYGVLPWRAVLEPARRLAQHGFPASQRLELILGLQVPVMKQFPATARVFLHGADVPLKQGDVVKQPDLAATIRRLQKSPRDFYEGETARLIAEAMAAHGGTITLADLKSYQAIALPPVESTYRGHRIFSAPPSSSGGTTLLAMLNILETFPMPLGGEGSVQSRHLMVEAMRRAFRDRSLALPVDKLVSKQHAAELASSIKLDQATPLPHGSDDPVESNDTTHFSVVDGNGNLVANTYTLNGFFGSQVIPEGTGVLLNDIMSAFSSQPGRNEIAPGKRPVSSMTPTIILRTDGRPWLALGSPGSATIPNTVLQVIVNLVDFKMSLRDAIDFPRIHHQNHPDAIDAEPAALVEDVAQKMRSFGHTLNPKLRSQGDVHAAGIDTDGWRIGWSDGRRGGRASGY